MDYAFPPDRHLPAVPALEDRMRPDAVAALLGISVGTLRNWRSQGTGPEFYRCGRIFYDKRDVIAWLASRRTNRHE